MSFAILFTPTARNMLAAIKNVATRRTILGKIQGLTADPEHQGKPLVYSLRGLRSIPAAGRYRIIYRVLRDRVVVLVLAVGERKEGDNRDIYELARTLLNTGLIDAG
jgi:mRNA interferase RelE/StbE